VKQPRLAHTIARAKLSYDALHLRIGLLRRHFGLQSDRAIYLSLATLEHRRSMPTQDTGPLTRYELRCFSQNGEDGVLAEIIARIGSERRFFVEFGIQDGREGNCVLLADVEGWSGLFIEANPVDYAKLEAKYQSAATVQTVSAHVSLENVEALFQESSVPHELDVLSIDVDGQDYWIWEALDSYRPRTVVIEYNSALPAAKRWVSPRGNPEPWDGSDYVGSSLAALEDLASRKGYVLVHTDLTGLNAFFVRKDLAEGRFPPTEQIPRRVVPNYHLDGISHTPDPHGRTYVDLDVE
jgi:hypothetical protein